MRSKGGARGEPHLGSVGAAGEGSLVQRLTYTLHARDAAALAQLQLDNLRRRGIDLEQLGRQLEALEALLEPAVGLNAEERLCSHRGLEDAPPASLICGRESRRKLDVRKLDVRK